MKRSAIIFLTFTLFFGELYAQGEQLFKARCSNCHILGKNATGPDLLGVKEKWAAADEGELLRGWVKNPAGLISSGKSKMAVAIKDYSPSPMPPQALADPEIDAVLSYIETYKAPPVDTSSFKPGMPAVNQTDYKGNLALFGFLLVLAFIQLGAILVISDSLVSVLKSFIEIKTRMKAKTLMALTFLLTVQPCYALQFSPGGGEGNSSPWLLVEKNDLYILLGINGVLLLVLLYLGNLLGYLLHNKLKQE